MGYSGFQFVQSLLTEREASSFAAQAMFYEERYRIGKERLPEVPAEAADLRQAVELVDKLGHYKADPLQMMVLLSEGMRGFENIRIDRLNWAASVDPDAEIGAFVEVGTERHVREGEGVSIEGSLEPDRRLLQSDAES